MNRKQEILDLKKELKTLNDRIINLEISRYLQLNPYKYDIHDKVKAKVFHVLLDNYELDCIIINKYVKYEDTRGYVKYYEVSLNYGYKTGIPEDKIVELVDNSLKDSKKQSKKAG